MVRGTTLSNHARVILSLDMATHFLAPCSCRIPDSIYAGEEVHSRIVDLWDREWDPGGDRALYVSQALAESSCI